MRSRSWSTVVGEPMLMPDVRLWKCSGCGFRVWSATPPRVVGGFVSLDSPWIPHPTDSLQISSDCDVLATSAVLDS